MRTVLVSQRVDVVKSYGERRDCLDQGWCAFLETCGLLPVPVMNVCADVGALADAVNPAGIVLTGGNNLVRYGGDAPERDRTEAALIEMGVSRNIPVMGVCRGMQMIACHFGGTLERVEGHVATRHPVSGQIAREVNSYHGYSVSDAPEGFEVLARSADGHIEAMRHREKRVMAMMWHPERVSPFDAADIELFKRFFASRREER